MQLKVNGHIYNMYNQVSIDMKFDSLTDMFSISVYYDPDNAQHVKDFTPGHFSECQITHGGVLVLTGTILSTRFYSAGDPPKTLLQVRGYVKTGVLEDCCIVNTKYVEADANGRAMFQYQFDNKSNVGMQQYTLQLDNMKLVDIVRTVTAWYDLGEPVVDPDLLNDAAFNTPYTTVVPTTDKPDSYQDMTVVKFLDKLCTQKNVVLSHNAKGQVVITRPRVDKTTTTDRTLVRVDPTAVTTEVAGAPDFTAGTTVTTQANRPILHNFTDTDPKCPGMELEFDGQKMHRVIQVAGEAGHKNYLDKTTANPFVAVGVKRFVRMFQDAGNDTDTVLVASAAVREEMKNITLTIEVEGWTLGGNLIVPNQLITVKNKNVGLRTAQKWFIQSAVLFGDERLKKTTITCVIPQCFGNEPIVNNYF